MIPASEERQVAVVSACMRRDGFPAFVLTEVTVTAEEEAEGVHYLRTADRLLTDGFEEPFVHFDDRESPWFLHPAVRTLAHSAEPAPVLVSPWEDR